MILGVHGKARSGKDTIAQWLGEHRGAFKASFAAPMKQALVSLFGLTWDHFEKTELKEAPLPGIGRSPRYLAQTLGTDWGRNLIHPDVWVLAMEQYLRGAVGHLPNVMVVIPDVRFENEAAFVRKHGYMIHVSRNGADGQVGIKGHASEAGVVFAPTDLRIENNGSLDDLYGKLGTIFPRDAA